MGCHWRGGNPSPDELTRAAFHGLKPLSVECFSNLCVWEFTCQRGNAMEEVGSTEQVFGNFHHSHCPALPADFCANHFVIGLFLQEHSLNHTAQQILLLLIGDALLIPVIPQVREDCMHVGQGALQLLWCGTSRLVCLFRLFEFN